jgi:hypothetical protein
LAQLVRIEKEITDALLTVRKYVKYTTGREAGQEEIANSLKSYFILNEIGNQIKYQRKKPPEKKEDLQTNQKRPFWTLNLITSSHQHNFTKAGLFSDCVREGIQTVLDFVKKTTGEAPSQEEMAESLKCSFILSEIKNQINWQRKNPQKTSEKVNWTMP